MHARTRDLNQINTAWDEKIGLVLSSDAKPEMLEKLVKQAPEEDFYLLRLISEHPRANAKTLNKLAKHPYGAIRENVARHPNADAGTLTWLSRDRSQPLWYLVAFNPNTPTPLQRRLRDRLKRLGLADRDVREHFAVEIDTGELDAVHELRIGQAVLASTGVDALDPQGAKVALAVAPVAIGVAQPLLDLFDRDAVGRAAAPAVTLGELEDLLVASVGRNPAFDACQGSPPQVRHIGQHELGIALLQDLRAARLAFRLLVLADQPVAFVGVGHFDLAGGGAAKPLLRTALCLELGHPNIRIRLAAPGHASVAPLAAHSSRAI